MPRPKIRLCDMPGFDCWKLGMLKSYSSDLLFDFETIYKLQSERFAEFMPDDFKREIEETICSLHNASAGLKVMNNTRIYLMTDFNQVHALMGLFGKPLDNRYMANIEKNIDTSGMMMFDYGHFKAITIGAKDCKAPVMNTIQGDKAAIVVNTSLNQLKEYTVYYNDGKSEVKSFEDKHRLSYEFKEFIRMIKEKDFKKQQEMLNLSLEIAKVMVKGRKQEGIVFDNDR